MMVSFDPRSSLPVSLSLLALLVAGPASADLAASLTDSLALPPGVVTGLTWAGTDTLALLVSLPDTLRPERPPRIMLMVGDTQGTVYWQEDFTGVLARGLAFDGEFFWSCGDDSEGGSLLYKIRADTVAVVAAYPTPGHRPLALAHDGRWLWLTDRDQARIHRIDPETGDPTRTVAAPGFSPVGLAWDGRALWLTDSGTGRLTRLRGARLEQRDDVAADDWFLRGQDTLLGHDGRHLWILPAAERYLRRLVLH
jgi:outer membrane protein assembly factor BamB